MLGVHNFSRMAQECSATFNADSLRRAREFVAIRRTGKSRSEGTRAIELHVKRNCFPIDSASQRRGTVQILKGSRQFCALALKMEHTRFRTQAALP
jgi:hypothetical protein